MRTFPLAGLIVLAFLLTRCDSVPNVIADDPAQVSIAGITFSPPLVDLAMVPNEWLSGDRVAIPFEMSGTLQGQVERIARIEYSLEAPGSPVSVAAQGTLTRNGSAFSGSRQLLLPLEAIGNYSLLVTVITQDERIAATARGTLRLLAPGAPPVIERVEFNPPVVRPPTTLRVFVTVSHPGGLGRIARVEGRAPNGNLFQLYDDGQTSGDAVAGDGRYTASFDVPAAAPGDQTFRFWAVDRTGQRSEEITATVTIQ
jgi:hypothetical protein